MAERLFVSCGPGLEPALLIDLGRLGYSGHAEQGGVTLEAPEGTHQRINLWSRVGGRVLLRLAEVSSPAELKHLDLSSFVGDGGTLRIEAAGEGATPYVNALLGRFGASTDGQGIYLRVARNRCTVSIDTTGDNLYLRGYRQEIGRAPMRETLAAGMLVLAGYDGQAPLWDVMCGSGTLLIEAALLASAKAPGALRPFAFQRWPSFRAQTVQPITPCAVPMLRGSDLNAGALGTARRNARRAGVFDLLTLERLDATAIKSCPAPMGWVVANLPYGKRVGEDVDLPRLARALSKSIRASLPGWRFAFLMAEGVDALELPTERKIALDNGGIAVSLVTGTVPSTSR